MKKCSACDMLKARSEFHVRRASADGLTYKCKMCANANSEKWRKEHPLAHVEWYAKNRAHKAIYNKAWRERNKDVLPARIAAWSKLNPDKINANIAKRTAAKLRAIPQWADLQAVAAVYATAGRMRRETGIRYEVDHIVPLQGKTVCGLHCEANLQIMVKEKNIAKLNRHWPWMP